MPIADEIATAAVLNELVCRELMPSMMAGLLTRRQRRPML